MIEMYLINSGFRLFDKCGCGGTKNLFYCPSSDLGSYTKGNLPNYYIKLRPKLNTWVVGYNKTTISGGGLEPLMKAITDLAI
jgi:hypothetical protein